CRDGCAAHPPGRGDGLRRPAAAGTGADSDRDRVRHGGVCRRAGAPRRDCRAHGPCGRRGAPVSGHLVIMPVLVPFLAGALLLLLSRRGLATQRALALASVLATSGVAILLLAFAADGGTAAYRLG